MKKPKTYNLNKSVYEAINKKAIADGRKDSDWLNRFLTAELVEVEIKPVKTPLVNPKFNFKNELLLLGANEDVLSDWLKVRAKKKASNTKSALKALLGEISKSGLMVNDAIEYAAGKSWSGFKAQWYLNEEGDKQAKQFSKTTEQNINTIRGWLNE